MPALCELVHSEIEKATLRPFAGCRWLFSFRQFQKPTISVTSVRS